MRGLYAMMLAVLLTSCSRPALYSPDQIAELERLDRTLHKKAEIEAKKEKQLNEIRSSISEESGLEDKFWCYDRLYHEFSKYNIDSSMLYAGKKYETAVKLADEQYQANALMNLAEAYTMSCMYTEAGSIIDAIDTSRLEEPNLRQFYHRKRLLYDGLAENCEDENLRRAYVNKRNHYIRKVLNVTDRNDDSYYHVTSELLAEQGKYAEAIELLQEHYSKKDISMNSRAITCYLMARSYTESGDLENALLYYTISSYLDLETPIYGYRSLCELSIMLFERGDIERSYTYMVRSFDDITKSNHMSCLESLYQMIPIVSKAYDAQTAKKNRQLMYILIALSAALIFMFAFLYVYAIQRNRTRSAELVIEENTDELKHLNIKLMRYIDKLRESDDIKDSYLGKYLDMCSDYIEGLARYRSILRHISKEQGADALAKALKSTEYIDSELKRFYAEFDATFLTIFPLFIPQLNELLQPDKQFQFIRGGSMTTELRVLALIRLGITDSSQIARFLRRSTSTIYNYRVKMRNSALGNRDEFERNLMKIGKPS